MKIILEIDVPEINHGMLKVLFAECAYVPDEVTQNGNMVFRTGLDTGKKEKHCLGLVEQAVITRLKPIDHA